MQVGDKSMHSSKEHYIVRSTVLRQLQSDTEQTDLRGPLAKQFLLWSADPF